ncbi:hypothetical protein TrVFT333_010499 [Trichoderma virens FT-333]|nr:hypothetical protein TrVFT333_010499 [Trichoderma virens FT-333]
MGDDCDNTADDRAPPLSRAGPSPSHTRFAAINETTFGDDTIIHQGDQKVHIGQLNHVINHYAGPQPQPESNPRCDSLHDGPDTPCWTVPFGRNKDFVGRESTLDLLLSIIPPTADEDDCQQTVISGLGGIGKTQVALEAAFRIRDKYPDCHVFWVPAIDTTTFENAYREIGRKLKLHGIDNNAADIKLLVKVALSQRIDNWLLIIDNADDAALFKTTTTTEGTSLSDSLPFSLKGSILFTTRNDEVTQQLDIRRENILHLAEMSRSEATNMLQKSLSAHQINDEQSLESLLEFLTDLPLAIKQASAYMIKTGMVVSKYLEHCRSSDEHLVELLSKDFNDRARYKTTKNPVATTWLISFRAISRDNPLAAKYLQFMAFVAEKDIPKHLLPLGDSELETYEAIGMLRAYAFISERAGQDAYDMHRLVRLVMQNWLRKEGDLQLCVTEVIKRLNAVFPRPRFSNKDAWARYLPHAIIALKFQDHSLDQASRSAVLSKTANSLYILGKYKDATMMDKQEIELATILQGNSHPYTLSRMSNLSSSLNRQGQYKEAEEIIRQTLKLQIKVLGAEHSDTLISMTNLAKIFFRQGQYKEAEEMNRQTLKLQIKVLGAEHPHTLTSMSNLSSSLFEQGQYNEAEEINQQTLDLQLKVLGAEHPHTLTSMRNLSSSFFKQGQYKEAEEINRQTLDLQIKVLGAEHPQTITSMRFLFESLVGQGQYKEAEEIIRQTIKLQIKILGAEHPDTITSIHRLERFLSSQS